MKRVLITGGHGFIGKHCIGPLQALGFEVHVASRGNAAGRAAETVHQCDLMDRAAVGALLQHLRPTHLLHLAWVTEPGQFWNSPENTAWKDASTALFDVFVASGGKRFVGAGSCAEYDWSFAILDEATTPLRPATPYGRAKNEVREQIEAKAMNVGVSFAWGRTFFLYGPEEKQGRLVGDVVRGLLRNEPVDTTEGLQVLDYMHVADVGAAFARLTACDVRGAINIASGRVQPVGDLLRIIGEVTGREDLIRRGARPTGPGQPDRLEAVVTRLACEVGFSPRFSLEAGLRQTVEQTKQAAC
jgi:nucleoside-diphosphate-sugar epimerase